MAPVFPVWILVAAAGLVLSVGWPDAFGGLGQTLGAVVAIYACLFYGMRDQAARRRHRAR